jgi:hypothetical protein
MTLERPRFIADLEPPFRRIGEEGWEDRFRALLRDYEVPTPAPVPRSELEALEAILGVRLDESVREFLRAIGPVDFDSLRVLSLPEIKPLEDVWFASHLDPAARAKLPLIVAVLDYLGTGDFVGWDRASGAFVLVRHDPKGIFPWHSTFDDCVREQCVELARGRYGWPEEDVGALVEEAKRRFVPLVGQK